MPVARNIMVLTIYGENPAPLADGQGAIYFVHLATVRYCRQGLSARTRESLVMTVMKHFETNATIVPAYVVMDDHVHVLVRPAEGSSLHRISSLVEVIHRHSARAGLAEGWRLFGSENTSTEL